MDDLTPVTDPALIAQLTRGLDDDEGPVRDPRQERARQELAAAFSAGADTIFELPAGYLDRSTEVLIREVEVRELTGNDEEALSKIKNEGRQLAAILERATVRIGEEKATPRLLDELLVGDRDAILLGIRRATFGDDLELAVTCPHCQERQDIVLNLTQDVPVKKHEDADERFLRVEGKRGSVLVELPTGRTQKKLLSASDSGKTVAELNTILLTDCVTEIENELIPGEHAVKRMSLGDRATVIDAIVKAAPGPQLNEVSRTCVACSKEIELPLSLSDLFRP